MATMVYIYPDGNPTVRSDPTYHRVRCSSKSTQGSNKKQDQSYRQDGACLLRPKGGERKRATIKGSHTHWSPTTWCVVWWKDILKKCSPRIFTESQNHLIRRSKGVRCYKRKNATEEGRPADSRERGKTGDKTVDSCRRQARPKHTATTIVSHTHVQSRRRRWAVSPKCCHRRLRIRYKQALFVSPTRLLSLVRLSSSTEVVKDAKRKRRKKIREWRIRRKRRRRRRRSNEFEKMKVENRNRIVIIIVVLLPSSSYDEERKCKRKNTEETYE